MSILFRELQTATIEHPRLDRDALIQRVGESREIVAILETFTSMLGGALHVARHGLARLTVVLDRPEAAGQAFALGEADELAPEVYHRALQLFRAKYGLDGRDDTEKQVIFNLLAATTRTRRLN